MSTEHTVEELFRRTKRASWSINICHFGDGDSQMYATHHGCTETYVSRDIWSWLNGEGNQCYNCDTKVPNYIQALIKLYEGQ